MKRTLVFISLLISCYIFSQSADSLLKKYDQQFVYRYGSSFMKGGNKLSFSDLQGEFSPQSLSFDLYKKSKKDKTISMVLRLISAVAIFGVVKGASDNNRGLAYGFLAGQFATGLAGQFFYDKSITGLDRALQIRNREVLFPGR
jgi:hypothetical protein